MSALWARKRALPSARDASELPSRKVHPHLFNIIIDSPSSPSHHHFHFILTQLALPKHVQLDRKPNTAALTAPCAFPFGLVSCSTPLRWHRRRRPRRSPCTFRDTFATKILVLNLFSTLSIFPFFFFTFYPQAAGLDTRAVVPNIPPNVPYTSPLSIPSLARPPPPHTPATKATVKI